MPSGVEKRRRVGRIAAIESGESELRAELKLGPRTIEIAYRSADCSLEGGEDALFAAALPIAMRRARELHTEAPISPRLLASTPRIQEILSFWNERLEPVEVRAEARQQAQPKGRGTAAFFSCGVDSFYTAISRREELDALIYVHDFDFSLADKKQREGAAQMLRTAAEGLGLPLVEVETNLREVSHRNANWIRIYMGAALASVGLALGSRFDRILIPATHTLNDLHRTGTHPLIDPLWSTERVAIEHVDAIGRVEKLETVTRNETAMRNLRVCQKDHYVGVNCGTCNKCIRTMAGLRVVGALGRCETLPSKLSLRRLAFVEIPDTEHPMTFQRENLAEAESRGSDRMLVHALRHLNRRAIRKEARAERRKAISDLGLSAKHLCRRLTGRSAKRR